ncbi:universal stress protein [Paenibacillus agricola]|uniref:Universal stress protein n=1 Tax=Paenibacillus agricola TaxID=2716264 RepID=A0ABX0IYY5_9BACL|nr:universal stress protein [Paenibacillus agricola]NHN28435.1 universal stress protein [Paenibacillus agricola]
MLFTKILVAYDGSNLSKKALEKAVALIQETNALQHVQLEIIHVYHYPSVVGTPYFVDTSSRPLIIEQAKEVIDEAKASIPPNLPVKYVLLQGPPAATILQYAEEKQHDLLITGSRGLSTIREFFLGSVSHYIVQHAKVPVMIVK